MAGFLSVIRRLYLTVYNWTVFFGWLQVLYIVLKTLKESGHEHVYDAAEKPLLYAQTAAVLEVLCKEELIFLYYGHTHLFVSSENIQFLYDNKLDLHFFFSFLVFGCGIELLGVIDSSWFGWAGAISSNRNLATDKFKVVPNLGHLMEFP